MGRASHLPLPPTDGYYLHMLAVTFPPGGVARLRSPLIWEQGPMCIRFAYRLFGFSWGAQLRLLLQAKQKGKHPITLWKHRNYQSPSWVPTAITVPAAGLFLPRRVSGVAVGVAQSKGGLAGTAGSYLLASKMGVHRLGCSVLATAPTAGV